MSRDCVAVDALDSVWTVTLERPQQGNACSSRLVAELDEILQEAERERVTAVVVRGAGKHFCTGFDLSAIDDETDDSLLARFVRVELMLQRLARAPFLTVAVAHGRAIGAGADLFTACAVRLVEGEGASFSFPGARGFGLVLGTRRLCAVVGRATALDWVETGRAIATDEALRSGLATGSIPPLTSIHDYLGQRLTLAPSLRRALGGEASPEQVAEDALDLAQLVDSAARPGLRDRIAAYAAGATRRRAPSPPSTPSA